MRKCFFQARKYRVQPYRLDWTWLRGRLQNTVLASLVLLGIGGTTSSRAIEFVAADLVYAEDFEGESSLPSTPETDLTGTGSLLAVGLGGFVNVDISDGRARLRGDHSSGNFNFETGSLQAPLATLGTGSFGIRVNVRGYQGLGGPTSFVAPSHLSLVIQGGSGNEEVRFSTPVGDVDHYWTQVRDSPIFQFGYTEPELAYGLLPKDLSESIQADAPYQIDFFFDRVSGQVWGTIAANGRTHATSVVDYPEFLGAPIQAVVLEYTAQGFAIGVPFESSVDIESIELYAADSTPSPSPIVSSVRKVSALDGVTGPIDADDRFGISIVNIGDQNGDGIDDLAAGADLDDDGGTNTGAIYILFMNADGTVDSEQKISALSGNFPGTLSPDDRFGHPIEMLSDLDGDGRREIAVGARRTPGGGFRRGAVWILDLNADGTVESVTQIAENTGGFTGTLPDGSNLSTMANLGDVNGDGFDDLAVGAWGDSGAGAPVGGAAWVLFLDGNGLVIGQQSISAPSLELGDRFGSSLAGIGDIDGDGVPDLAVAADSADYTFNGFPIATDSGEVWIFRLNADGTVKGSSVIGRDSATGDYSPPIFDNFVFGLELAPLGDWNGDGIPDLAAGAAGARGPQDPFGTGGAFILFLNEDGSLKDYRLISDRLGGFGPSLAENDFLGVSLRALGDIDGDGLLDLGMGAVGDDDGASNAGAFYLVNVEPDSNCDWKRHLDQGELVAEFSSGVEIFDFSTVALDANGDAGFSNGHDFGRFAWTSLSIGSDIDLFGSPDPDGTLWVTDQFGPPIQGSPGAGGPSGSVNDDDDFQLDFSEPMAAVGLEILENRADAGEHVTFFDASGNQITQLIRLPGSILGAPGGDGGGFVGLSVCEGHPGISSVVIREGNFNNTDNDDIGFTNVVTVPVPEPAAPWLISTGILGLTALRRSPGKGPLGPTRQNASYRRCGKRSSFFLSTH